MDPADTKHDRQESVVEEVRIPCGGPHAAVVLYYE